MGPLDKLKVTIGIKPHREHEHGNRLNSSAYSVKINDWELGRGVTHFSLDMKANEKPTATITFRPDVIEVDGVVADLETLLSEIEGEENA
ncbi:hypothetical protein ACXM1Q_000150 [Streptococcus sp. 10F2]